MIKTDPPFQSWEAITAKLLCTCCFSVEGCAEIIHRAPTCCGKKPTKTSSLHINSAYGAALSLHTEDVPYDTSRCFHTYRCQRFHLLADENCFSKPKHHLVRPNLASNHIYRPRGIICKGRLRAPISGLLRPSRPMDRYRAHGRLPRSTQRIMLRGPECSVH